MKKKPFILGVLFIVLLIIGYLIFAFLNKGGIFPSLMVRMLNQNTQTISSSNETKQMNASLKDTVINKKDNTIRFNNDNVKIVLLGGPEEADGKFVVGDLINPTIYVPKHARVTFELINADQGMPHGFEITTVRPPYAQMPMMQGGVLKGAFIRPIPAAHNNQYPVKQTSFQVNQAGQYYYICQYPGHAADGMYGKIIFE